MVRFTSSVRHAASLGIPLGRPVACSLTGFKRRLDFSHMLLGSLKGTQKAASSSFIIHVVRTRSQKQAFLRMKYTKADDYFLSSAGIEEGQPKARGAKATKPLLELLRVAPKFHGREDQMLGMRLRAHPHDLTPQEAYKQTLERYDWLEAEGYNRVGILASKNRIGLKAVLRNRARRRGMAAARDVLSYYVRPGFDILLIMKPPGLIMPLNVLRVELASMMHQFGMTSSDLPVHSNAMLLEKSQHAHQQAVWALRSNNRMLFPPTDSGGYARALYYYGSLHKLHDEFTQQLDNLLNKILEDGPLLMQVMNMGDQHRGMRHKRIRSMLMKCTLHPYLRTMLRVMVDTATLNDFVNTTSIYKDILRKGHVYQAKKKVTSETDHPKEEDRVTQAHVDYATKVYKKAYNKH